jgi:hypothetical protein
MQLKVAVERAPADRSIPKITDTLQFISKGWTIIRRASVNPIQIVGSGKASRRHHGRRKSAAFLIRPVHDLDRPTRDMAKVVKRANHLQCAENTDYSIETSAIHLRIEVAAENDRRKAVVLPCTAAEYAASPIDRDGQAGITAPTHKKVPHFLVSICQSQAGETTLSAFADVSGLFDCRPETVRVDARRGSKGHGRTFHKN